MRKSQTAISSHLCIRLTWNLTGTSWVVSYGGKTFPRWRTAAILKINISPYLSIKSSDFVDVIKKWKSCIGQTQSSTERISCSKTTTLLPSAKCTRPPFQGRTGCGGRPSVWHDIVTCQRLVVVYICISRDRLLKFPLRHLISIDQFSYAEENSQTTAFRRQNTQNVGWMKRQFSACQTPRSIYPSMFNSFPVILTATEKIAVFTYRSPHFGFPWRRPCDYHAICSMDGKTIQCLPNPSQHMYLSIFNSFRVIRCLSQCVSPAYWRAILIYSKYVRLSVRP